MVRISLDAEGENAVEHVFHLVPKVHGRTIGLKLVEDFEHVGTGNAGGGSHPARIGVIPESGQIVRAGHVILASTGTQLSFKELAGEYVPRRPEQTVLYQAVARNFRTFEAMAEIEGKRIPKNVTGEFEAFLRCGILAHG